MIKTFNNKTAKVGDELRQDIKNGAKINVAAAIFSMYGFQSLSKELSKISGLRFIFTDPTFVDVSRSKKEQKQFNISSNLRKIAIGGSDFEINLRNELKGKAIAKECKKWIESKASFKTNVANSYIQPHLQVSNGNESVLYSGINEFSSAGFGYEKDNSILKQIIKIDDFQTTKEYLDNFNEIWSDEEILKDVTEDVIEYISTLYKENSPEFIYYLTLYNIFDEFLDDISEDELANEKTGFKESAIWNRLYDFQKDAVLGVINKLERHNGCILADSVGLGKTFTALGVIKYYQERNRSVLVLCPKKLGDNWLTFLNNYEDNILYKDRFNYDVLYHTDLSRNSGESNGMDLSRINWGNYDLVVIDESHNFRNNDPRKDKITRYQKLLNDVMRAGVRTKVLMLSATPVNNRFNDLKNQIALAYEGNTGEIDEKMDISKSIDFILSNAQKVFNEWSKLPIGQRTGQDLLARLNSNFDFFKLLDSVTIARSRKHIEKYYDMNKIGKFPTRLKPITKQSDLTDINGFMAIDEIYKKLSMLNMSVYSPFDYILEHKKGFYGELYDTDISENVSLRQSNREKSLQKLMRINLLKRLESSVESFRITLNKFASSVNKTLESIDNFERNGKSTIIQATQISELNTDSDSDDWLDDEFNIGDKVKINLEDMNTIGWKEDLKADYHIAVALLDEMNKITPERDQKLSDLKEVIENKILYPINNQNKKILIFSAFADTTNYLFKHISKFAKDNYGLETAKVVGTDQNECTLDIDKRFNNILINFSPIAKERRGDHKSEIDILIATDCISEGQNLQDCDYLINYDIHWNPVKIIQRFGRIDRIGSKNDVVQLVNFWPNISLDDYINLKNRVENRMLLVDATATGEDNVLTNESAELEYRKKQLEKLQTEVVDLEEMNTGISITDLGLNDFRMDLVSYIDKNGPLDGVPNGMHSVCKSDPSKEIKSGAIFVLKNRNNAINIENTNQLHPFYLVYISNDGDIISNHLNVKSTLDTLRIISRGRPEPLTELCEQFNNETDDGRNMDKYSRLLSESIQSIVNVKDEGDVNSLFSAGGTTALVNDIKGLEDFELISFIVIK